MNTILVLLGAYFAVLGGLSLLARPYRLRLGAIGASFAEGELDEHALGFVRATLTSAYSWRAAIMLFLVYLMGIFETGERLDQSYRAFEKDHPMLARDPRVHQMMDAYFASVAAVNPTFGLLAYLAMRVFRLKARMHHSALNAERLADFRGLSVPV